MKKVKVYILAFLAGLIIVIEFVYGVAADIVNVVGKKVEELADVVQAAYLHSKENIKS